MTVERAWTRERHEAAVARCAAATRGPWQWGGVATSESLYLFSPGGPFGMQTVMAFRRWGMQGAQPVFQVCGLLHAATQFLVKPEPHNAWRITDIDHPDAQFIAHAPTDLPDALAEIEQLRRELDTALLQLGEAQREVTRITAVTWSMGCALGFYANVLNYRERFDAYGQWTSDIQGDAGEIARNALAAAAPGGAS